MPTGVRWKSVLFECERRLFGGQNPHKAGEVLGQNEVNPRQQGDASCCVGKAAPARQVQIIDGAVEDGVRYVCEHHAAPGCCQQGIEAGEEARNADGGKRYENGVAELRHGEGATVVAQSL